MSEIEMKRSTVNPIGVERSFVRGLVAALPIVIGYVPIALTYGLLARQADIPLLHIVMMSALVYAGASQFMAVNMIAAGSGAIEIVFATFILNLRHFIMGLSMMNMLRYMPIWNKLLSSAWMTDETFALTSLKQKEVSSNHHSFVVGLMIASYASWVVGSFVGALLADFIPSSLSQSMAIALYAMFIGLLVPSIRKQWRIGVIAVVSMFVCYLFNQIVSSGWAIVGATLVGALVGAFVLKEEDQS